MATVPESGDLTRPRGQTTAAVEDSETWVESKRYTVYKVLSLYHL